MSLDQLLRDVGQELDRLSELHQEKATYAGVTNEGGRRKSAVVAAVVLAIVGVVAIGAVALRHDSVPGSTVSGTIADRLLFPALGTSGLHILQALETPTPPGRWAGLAISPNGDAFGVNVFENFWGSLPADQEQRSINGRTVSVQSLKGMRGYSISEPCALIAVSDQRTAAQPWDGLSTSFLSDIAIDGGLVSVKLPDGWRSLGVGETDTLFELSYQVTLGGTTHTVSLTQMLDVPVGTLLAQVQAGASVRSTDFRGAPAWLTARAESKYTSIAWPTGNGAALLSVDNASTDELKQVASTLAPQHGNDWAKGLQHDPSSGTATSAPRSETPLCARSLDIHP